MRERIVCPFHKEETPSLVLYHDTGRYHCFGCQAHGLLTELGRPMQQRGPRYVQDHKPMVEYIRSLPHVRVRCLDLPADSDAYYVLWPTGEYYKRCVFNRIDGTPKYKGPAGVPKPLFPARIQATRSLIVIEGELNALSVATVIDGIDVVSPGGTGDFTSSRFENDVVLYKKYERIYVISDKDAPGALAAIGLKTKLTRTGCVVTIHLMERDANDWLTQYGTEALKEEINRYLDMSEKVRLEQRHLPAPGSIATPCGTR